MISEPVPHWMPDRRTCTCIDNTCLASSCATLFETNGLLAYMQCHATVQCTVSIPHSSLIPHGTNTVFFEAAHGAFSLRTVVMDTGTSDGTIESIYLRQWTGQHSGLGLTSFSRFNRLEGRGMELEGEKAKKSSASPRGMCRRTEPRGVRCQLQVVPVHIVLDSDGPRLAPNMVTALENLLAPPYLYVP